MVISDLSIKRPVFAAVMMLALVTLGIFSYRRLAIDMYPDVEIPVLSVLTVFEGAAPESVEREVSKPLEEAVNPIAGVKRVGSISREGVSQVWVEFEIGVDINNVSQEARAKVSAIRGDLPQSIEEPVIEKLDFSSLPVISVAIRSDTLTPRDLTTLVEKKVQRRIQNLMGVGRVDLVGPAKRQVNVDLDPARLEALGMGVDEVIAGLQSENVNTPLGRLTRRGVEVPVRVQGKPDLVDDFRRMVVAQRLDRPVTLGDVAEVRDGIEEQRSMAFVNGIPAVALDVMKQSGANTVAVVDAVKKEVEKLRAELPPDTGIEVVRDSSISIRASVRDVQETLLLGGLLTVLIVFCFLNSWRSTVITGLTLPISVISSFIVMNFAGMTLNMLTLMALSLAIGLLIDDAIVVRENIVRHLERGEDHFTAARNGTNEIGLAVMATTFSIVAVFVPVAYMKGIVGRFFFQFGITVAFAVLVSLFVSFTLDPMLSSRWFDPDIRRAGRRHFLARVLDRFNDWFDRTADRYRNVIAWSLGHRKTVMGLATAAFLGGMAVFVQLEQEFITPHDMSEFQLNFKTAPDASIRETENRLQAVLASLEGIPEIDHTYGTIGAREGETVRDVSVYVKLVDRRERSRKQKTIMREVRARLAAVPGIVVSVMEAEQFDDRKPLMVGVRGEDLKLLKQYAARLKEDMYRIPGIVDLEVSLEHETPEYRLVVDRERTEDAGVNTAAIVRSVGALVGGLAVSTYEDEDGDAVDVQVRMPEDGRGDISQVENLRLTVHDPVRGPTLVRLGDLARYERSTTPSEINRIGLRREVLVSANLDGMPLGTAGKEVQKAAGLLELPPGYRVVLYGQTEEMEESFGYLGEALLLAVIMVYLILAAQFESFVDPLAIMLSLPLSVVGMALMLAATGDTLNIMSMIGLIMLMGLVTKNAILLVDFTKVLRGRGVDRKEALIQAGRLRLRPILMTTTAMIFGMMPLALGLGSAGEVRAPMARTIVGGLITSTLLTLLVVPVVYTVLDDFACWVRRRLGRGEAPAAEAEAVPVRARAVKGAGGAAVLLLAAGLQGLMALAWPEPVQAASEEEAAQPVEVLTLEKALVIAAEQNQDVKKALEFQNWVRGKYVQERAAALPNLSITSNIARQYDDSQREFYEGIPEQFGGIFSFERDVAAADVSLSQAVFTWGQVGAAIRAARLGIAIGEDQLRYYRQAVARDVSVQFYNVLLAKEMAAIAAENLEQKQRHLEAASRKLAAGTATEYDVLAASVEVQNARPELIRAQNRIRIAKDRLNLLLGRESTPIEVEGTLVAAVSPQPGYEEVLEGALRNRPELQELAHRIGVAKELVKVSRAGDKPRLDVQAGYGWRGYNVEGLESEGAVWQAGLFLTFPFFDGLRTRGLVSQAKSDVRTAEIEEAKLKDAISLEAHTVVDAVQESGEIVTALSGTVAQAERLLYMAEMGYEHGVKTNLDVLDAQLNLSTARGSLARARRDYQAALVDLRWVTGNLGEGV
ncbi:MAG: efflux RND transporter permease subunit [bacterium]